MMNLQPTTARKDYRSCFRCLQRRAVGYSVISMLIATAIIALGALII